MLLRRFTEHLKTQNWFAVGIDFVIVVVGVFLGIQVANWNEAQAEAQLGEQYRDRMIADLENDKAIYQGSSNYFREVLLSIEEADRLLSSPNPDPRELVIAAYRASEYMSNPPNRTTWEQVVASGHVDLLPSHALENGIADYYRFNPNEDASGTLLMASEYRSLVRSIIPLTIQLDIRENCSDVVDENNYVSGFVEACELDSDPAALTETARAIRSSPTLHAELRNQYSTVSMVDNNATGSIPVIERLLTMLKEAGGS